MSDEIDIAEKVELPHRSQVEPITGYKKVTVIYERGDLSLKGVYGTYGTDERARCHAYPKPEVEHEAPNPDCKCGFYAFLDENLAKGYYSGNALATVEAFGFVILHEKGFRASRQRIASLSIPQGCKLCEVMNDTRYPSDALYVPPSKIETIALCKKHGALSVDINAALRLSLDDISNELDIPVTWERKK